MNETIKLQVRTFGEGLPILLVPGGLTGWRSWEPFVEYFLANQRRVVLVQLLNVQYGIENRNLPEDYSVKTESTALSRSLDSIGIKTPIDVVAWSYGALVSLDYGLDHAEMINTLTMIEPPAIWVLRESGKMDFVTEELLQFFDNCRGYISEDALERFLGSVGFAKSGESIRDLTQWKDWVPYRQSLKNNPAIVAQRNDIRNLKGLTQPVLLVKGTGSALFLHQIVDVLAANLPNARVIEMPAGHAPHLVSKDKFLSELKNFQYQDV